MTLLGLLTSNARAARLGVLASGTILPIFMGLPRKMG